MYQIIKKITPQFILDLVGKYNLIRKTDSFKQNPLLGLFKFARWTIFEWIGREISFTTPDGTRFVSMSHNYSSFLVYFTNYRDPIIQAFIQSHISQGMVFVDAGANIGTYTVRASQTVGKEGKVIAIEAHPFTYNYLLKNIKLNNFNNITPINVALGAEQGNIPMSFTPANAGQTHIATREEKSITVLMKTLDEILADFNISRVDYLKIDVEGFELPLLIGSQKTIKNSPKIIVQTELIEAHSRRYNKSITDIIDLLSGLGLTPHTLNFKGESSVIKEFDLEKHYDVLWWRDTK